jgi:hypothetical protein
MDIVLTTAGIQAVINAKETGTNAVTISQIGVGTGKYTANKEQTQLQAQVKRLPILDGGQAGDNAIHVAYKDDGPGAYEVCEFGLFLSDGTLFAVYSQSTPIIAKQESSNLLLAIDLKLEGVNAGDIAFGDVSFSFTAATSENAGIVELATDEETQAGTDTQRAVTPAGLKSLTATAGRAGLIRTATESEVKGGTDSAVALTPANLKGAAATEAETIEGKSRTLYVTPVGLRCVKATTGRNGLVELATEEEAKAGIDKERAVTPAGLKAVVTEATPDASEASRGLIPIASTVEATTGLVSTKAMTPFTAKAAIDSRIATVEEVTVGTSTTKFVTPATLKAVIDAAVAAALAKQGGH